MRKLIQYSTLLGICLMLAGTWSFVYSFSAYNGMTGERTLAIVPTVYVPFRPAFGVNVWYTGAFKL